MKKAWETNHGAPIPPTPHPIYDVVIPGLGYGLKSRPGETPDHFAERLVEALFARGQGSDWQ